MYYVVGSGPAGIACAHALAASGRPVTILDSGCRLEPERDRIRRSVALRARADWTRDEEDLLKTGVSADGTVPLKRAFGSDYPYRKPTGAPDIEYGALQIRASYALGGLSNVWGATLLPFHAHETADWPVAAKALADSYTDILKIVPQAGVRDDLEEEFPLYSTDISFLRRSRQVQQFLDRADRNRAKLRQKGMTVGGARVAVDATGRNGSGGCYYCGHCLHGCPRDLIYSSRQSLPGLLARENVRYESGVVVTRVQETGPHVRITATREDGSTCEFRGERVFLAAGPLNSAAILLRSMARYDSPVELKDAQYYLFPLLSARGVPRVTDEALNTLCQAYIEISDEAVSPHIVHLQVYGFNDHIARILEHKLGALKHVVPANALLGRFLLIQGYLHSDHSGGIRATLKKSGDDDRLVLEPRLNPETRPMIGRVLRKLRQESFALGAFPAGFQLQVTEPGRGFHTGGSFPMAAAPGPGNTDPLGRPYGMSSVHVVDASVFPTIPATTITLTVMANAYRIGREVCRLPAPELAATHGS